MSELRWSRHARPWPASRLDHRNAQPTFRWSSRASASEPVSRPGDRAAMVSTRSAVAGLTARPTNRGRAPALRWSSRASASEPVSRPGERTAMVSTRSAVAGLTARPPKLTANFAGRAERAPASPCRDPVTGLRWSRHARPWPASRLDQRVGGERRPFAGRAGRAPASPCRDPVSGLRWSRHARPWPASRLDHRQTAVGLGEHLVAVVAEATDDAVGVLRTAGLELDEHLDLVEVQCG